MQAELAKTLAELAVIYNNEIENVSSHSSFDNAERTLYHIENVIQALRYVPVLRDAGYYDA